MGRRQSRIRGGMARKKTQVTKGSSPRERRNELRASILSLADARPFHIANPKDCPLFAFRRMKPARRIEWVDAPSESDLEYFNLYHRVCPRIKARSRRA